MTREEVIARLDAEQVPHAIEDGAVWVNSFLVSAVPVDVRRFVNTAMPADLAARLYENEEKAEKAAVKIDAFRTCVNHLSVAFNNYIPKVGRSWHELDRAGLAPLWEAIRALEEI